MYLSTVAKYFANNGNCGFLNDKLLQHDLNFSKGSFKSFLSLDLKMHFGNLKN